MLIPSTFSWVRWGTLSAPHHPSWRGPAEVRNRLGAAITRIFSAAWPRFSHARIFQRRLRSASSFGIVELKEACPAAPFSRLLSCTLPSAIFPWPDLPVAPRRNPAFDNAGTHLVWPHRRPASSPRTSRKNGPPARNQIRTRRPRRKVWTPIIRASAYTPILLTQRMRVTHHCPAVGECVITSEF